MKKVILFITLILFSLTLTACSFSLSQFMPETNEYLSDTEKVTVTKSDYYYAFKPKEYITGIIFYTKSETNVTDYAELMHKLAILGYITFILKSNENNYIESVFNNYTNVSNWYIGGHADGGIDASNYIYNNMNTKIKGIFLLASYTPVNLSDLNIKTLTVYGSKDKILEKHNFDKYASNLGENKYQYVISGGNHSYFSSTLLEGDEEASISNTTQIEQTISYIRKLVDTPLKGESNSPTVEPTIPSNPTEEVVTYTQKYKESIESFNNPDQGFYEAQCVRADTETISELNEEFLYYNSLIHLRIDISAYSSKVNTSNKDLELTSSMLNALDKMFKKVDDSGACMIVRFAYDPYFEGHENMEPKLSMILKHIEQFSPIINKYKHAISAVECGLVGPWGEMHSSELDNQTAFNNIFAKYLKCLDEDVILLVRRPHMIYEYYGYNLNNLDSFNYKNCRIGCYNDGYLGSKSDLGTFQDRTKEIAFLEKINYNKPYGGEVTVPNSSYNRLSWACEEMFRTNLTYLNLHWNDTVVERWQNTEYTLDDPLYDGQTEFTYISNHMGYRFVCDKLICNVSSELEFFLKLRNEGFGELYKHKKGFVILKNNTNQYVFEFDYNNELTIHQTFDLSSVKNGDYELYFVLADSFDKYAVRGIQFANENMYNEKLHANKLADITIK